jgi:enoyl-CoA hydratase/carnithine racemase
MDSCRPESSPRWTPDMAGLRVERKGAVATLVIENEGRRNSLTTDMWKSLPPTLDELAADRSMKVLVVRGAGDDFSAGADIRDLDAILHDPNTAEGGHVTAAENALARFPGATLAAIDGYCVGGGWELAGACDIRMSSERSTFGVTPARIGIVYPLSGIKRLVGIAGPAVAKLLLLNGELIDAPTALRFGMVTSVSPVRDFWADVAANAEVLASRSQLSIHAAKDLVDALVEGAGDAAARARRWQREVDMSGDPAIGAAAFLGRTEPAFTWTGLSE